MPPSRLPCRRLRTPRASPRSRRRSRASALVRSVNRPLPTCVNQTCIGPSRSDRNATNLPSGEIEACVSVPEIRDACELRVGKWIDPGLDRGRRGHTACEAAHCGKNDRRDGNTPGDGLGRGLDGPTTVGPRLHQLEPHVADHAGSAGPWSDTAATGRPLGGVVAGKRLQSGSSVNTDARMSETVSPFIAR